jgi:hypothetical protein
MHPKLADICGFVGLRWCALKMPEKKPYVPPTPPDVQEEIEIFRMEEEAAQQTFFAYLGIRDLLAERPDVLAAVNRNSMFWLTTNHALLVSTDPVIELQSAALSLPSGSATRCAFTDHEKSPRLVMAGARCDPPWGVLGGPESAHLNNVRSGLPFQSLG